MNTIRVWGNVELQGNVSIQGSKNATLPILAAALLIGETSYIRNCPKIADVYSMVGLLRSLGCIVHWQGDGLLVDSSKIQREDMHSDMVKGMRSSLCLLGALLGRCNEVVMEYPGGCVIGERPIDLHLDLLSQMGAEFEEKEGVLHATAKHLHGARLSLPKPSVGTTENVILAAVLAEGNTLLEGASKEPEVIALCQYLQQCGAGIEGVGTERLLLYGGRHLYGTEFVVPADRIVAGTYLFGCMGSGGNVFLEGAPYEQMESVLQLCERMGGGYCCTECGIYLHAPDRPIAVEKITTGVYPGFPTDLQSAALVTAAVADGDTIIEEKIFENRFRIVEELHKMGADIQGMTQDSVMVRGVLKLIGSETTARELRGGAALVLAGLFADGMTTISGCSYIDRGYENICRDFRELGARIVSV